MRVVLNSNMAIRTTRTSPGVEIREYDESMRATVPNGTTVVIPGFSSRGPVKEILNVSSLDEFEEIFGTPTNSAERYWYHTVKQVLTYSAIASCVRLPYGSHRGDIYGANYTMLAFPAKAFSIAESPEGDLYYTRNTNFSDGSTVDAVKDTVTYLIGEPKLFAVSLDQYYKFLRGQSLTSDEELVWSDLIAPTTSTSLADIGKFAMVAINVAQTVTNDEYEGYYLAMGDNAFSNPDQSYDSVTKMVTVSAVPEVNTAATYTAIPAQRLDFRLNGVGKGSVSQIMEESITAFDHSGDSFRDSVNIGIFKVRRSLSSGNSTTLSQSLSEAFNASLSLGSTTSSATSLQPVDDFIETITEKSKSLQFFVNPHVSGKLQARPLDDAGAPKATVRILTGQLRQLAAEIDTLIADEATTASDLLRHPAAISDKACRDLLGTLNQGETAKAPADASFGLADGLYPIGVYSPVIRSNKIIGNVPAKLEDAFSLVRNEELVDCDIIVDGGLSTIYVGAMDAARKAFNSLTSQEKLAHKYNGIQLDYVPSATIFDDTKTILGVEDLRTSQSPSKQPLATLVLDDWTAVANEILSVAASEENGGRGDTYAILDPIKHILVEGKSSSIETRYGTPLVNSVYTAGDMVNYTFSLAAFWPLRHLANKVTTCYAEINDNWGRTVDTATGMSIFVPLSGEIAGLMAATDSSFGPWEAAAGTSKGKMRNITGLAINPSSKQRDDLYKYCINSIVHFPKLGVVKYGIRTLSKQASVFDQSTCRRTVSYVEKITKATSLKYVFQGNTDYTRLQYNLEQRPVLDSIVNKKGLYNYWLVCDGTNNTPDVIDNGELVVDLYVSPTRTAERVRINVRTRRSGSILTEYSN